jgi:putative iron-dependent peroxidase
MLATGALGEEYLTLPQNKMLDRCVLAFGSDAWDRIFGSPRPAVATPGDLPFHIRAKRFDLCFELATQIMARLGQAVSPADEVHGFRCFYDRNLIGFVDGTENPTGQAAGRCCTGR